MARLGSQEYATSDLTRNWVSRNAGILVAGATAIYMLGMAAMGLLVQAYRDDPAFAHGFLIPVLSLLVAYERRERLGRAGESSRWIGPPLTLLGVAVTAVGHWYQVALNPGYLGHVFLEGLGVVLSGAGFCWSLLGAARVRVLAFPLAYLLLALPLPESWTTALTLPLRGAAVTLSAAILRATGTVVWREGNILRLAHGTLGVEDACSGLRSFWTLVAASPLLTRNLGAGPTLLLLLTVPVLAIVGNVVRLVVCGLSLGHFNAITGTAHTVLGTLTFVVSLAGLVLVSRCLARWCSAPATGCGTASRKPRPCVAPVNGWRASRAWPACLGCGALLFAFASERGIERHYAVNTGSERVLATERKRLADFPVVIGSFERVRVGALARHAWTMLQPTDYLEWTYAGAGGEQVRLTILYWEPQRITPRSVESVRAPHRPDVCYVAQGWERVKPCDQEMNVDWLPGQTLHLRLFRKPNTRLLLLAWNDNGWPAPWRFPYLFIPRSIADRGKALVASWKSPPTLTIGRRYAVNVAVGVSASVEEARATALDFAEGLAPLLPEYGIERATANDRDSPECEP